MPGERLPVRDVGDGRAVVRRGVEAARRVAVVVGLDLADLRDEDVGRGVRLEQPANADARRVAAAACASSGSRRAASSSATTVNDVVSVNLSVSPASIQPPVRSAR